MVFKVDITSDRKGSNPGGLCRVSPSRGEQEFDAYFKYCFGSKIPHNFPFKSDSQPVYEAITFALARQLGLKTSSTFVLLNKKNDVDFSGYEDKRMKDPSGRNYYFLSKILTESEKVNESLASSIVSDESVYLDGLLISDVLGKRQNYLFQKDSCGARVLYVDFGCSFVRCVDGFLTLPNKVIKAIASSGKKASKSLKGKLLVTADNSDFVSLEDMVKDIGDLKIPVLNPAGTRKVSQLISQSEIREIQKYLEFGLASNIPEFRRRELLE